MLGIIWDHSRDHLSDLSAIKDESIFDHSISFPKAQIHAGLSVRCLSWAMTRLISVKSSILSKTPVQVFCLLSSTVPLHINHTMY